MKTEEDNYYLSALLDGVYAPPLSISNNKNVAWPFPKQQRETLDIVTPSGLTDVASIDHRQTQVPGLARDDRPRDLHALCASALSALAVARMAYPTERKVRALTPKIYLPPPDIAHFRGSLKMPRE